MKHHRDTDSLSTYFFRSFRSKILNCNILALVRLILSGFSPKLSDWELKLLTRLIVNIGCSKSYIFGTNSSQNVLNFAFCRFCIEDVGKSRKKDEKIQSIQLWNTLVSLFLPNPVVRMGFPLYFWNSLILVLVISNEKYIDLTYTIKQP